MTKTPRWTKIVGTLSILPALYFWLWILGPKSWLASYPGKPGMVLIGILCAIPLSIVVATRGSRVWLSFAKILSAPKMARFFLTTA
jgi:hypothetical protein